LFDVGECGGHGQANRRGCRRGSTSLDRGFDLIALFRIQVTELVLDIQAKFTAQVEQILALHVQFARQNVDTHFFFLQAGLLLGITGGSGVGTEGRDKYPYYLF